MIHKLNIANAVTASRIVFAVFILFCPAFSEQFYVLYFLGAFTDMIDGRIARKLNQKSSFGAILDTIADFAFIAAVVSTILPTLYVPKWLWIWIAIISFIKLFNLIMSLVMFHRIVPMHTIMNKVTGIILFLLPFGIGRGVWQVSAIAAIIACTIATFAAIQEGYYIRVGREFE